MNRKRLQIINEINDGNCEFITHEQAIESYRWTINEVRYSNLKTAIQNAINNFGTPGISLTYTTPFRPIVVEYLNKQKKGCSFWSNSFRTEKNKTVNIRVRELKWENLLALQEGIIDWSLLYKLNMTITYENSYRFFHYQVLRCNLNTKSRSVNFRDVNDRCTFCFNERETNIHLLYECPIAL